MADKVQSAKCNVQSVKLGAAKLSVSKCSCALVVIEYSIPDIKKSEK
jgi:hypothetical protein